MIYFRIITWYISFNSMSVIQETIAEKVRRVSMEIQFDIEKEVNNFI